MLNRFKFAAALGLVIATASVADVSAKTVEPVATHKTVAGKMVSAKNINGKTIKIAGRHHRAHLAHRTVKHGKIAHRTTVRAKIAHKLGLKHVVQSRGTAKTTVIR